MAEQKTIAFFPEGAFGPALNSVGIAQACRDLGHRAVFISDPGFGDAILDRIVHNAHRLELDGPSMRKIKADKNRPATIDQAQGK